MARKTLLVLLTVLVTAAGCVDPPASPQDSDPDAELPTNTVAFRAVADAPGVPLLPEDVVVLVEGVVRHSGQPSWEPTIGISSQGVLYVSASQALPVNYFRSRDQGVTWEQVTAPLPPQSNDPYVHVDPDTDRVFTNDLQALVCSWMNYSDDEGQTWVTSPIGCGLPVGVHDHQTIGTGKPRVLTPVGYENLVYYCINRLVDSACAVSANGGVSFGPLVPVFNAAKSGCAGLHGHVKSAPDGTTYLPKGDCGGRVVVGRTVDDGLTWTTHTVAEPGALTHEANVAVDAAGNVYVLWLDAKGFPTMASSRDQGATWSTPVRVGHPTVTAAQLPAIAAGDEGRVAVAYVGTEAPAGTQTNAADLHWHAYLGVLADALAEQPVVQSVRLTPLDDPITKGGCGQRCPGVGDFIDIDIDPEGRPWGVYVDGCRADCLADGASGPDPRSATSVFVGTLATGPALRGLAGALPPLAQAGSIDA